MNARDVIDAIKYWDFDNMGMSSETTIGDTFGADAIIAALDKAGYAVVPQEPTEEMLNSGWRERGQQHSMTAVYKAMLTAAKETP